jgi:hypothetical protein
MRVNLTGHWVGRQTVPEPGVRTHRGERNECPGGDDGSADQIYIKWRTDLRRRLHKDKSLRVFLGRTTEIAVRLATIHAAAREPGDYDFVVTEADIRWGMALATVCGEMLAAEAKGKMVPEALEHGAAVKKVLDIIKKEGPIKHKVLFDRLYRQIKDLKILIVNLTENGPVLKANRRAPGAERGPKADWYYLPGQTFKAV